ncbi:LytR/AlgR family response regulator transcription factor [Aureivirga marina]|uniref:LytR/AlgR family response regulator transcription factor n=1 Tax=Aureivirga marina TaxID=1182451 RepID=UPI0018C904FB|nr:LytTR family DNA-binding domain-containing protein [Aureivirga marina]
MKYNCIIIDDEQPARKLLESYCTKIEDLNVLQSFKSAMDAILFMEKETVDIIFLDIQMPDLTGIDFLKVIQRKQTKIIFTTAYRDYAIEGFELDATDYLLKPIEFFRFLKAVNKAKKEIQQIPAKKITIDNSEKFIHLKSSKKQYRIAIGNIQFIKSENEYLTYFMNENQKLLVYGTLKDALQMISKSNFIRVHRSYIINLNFIDFVEGNRISIGNQFIPISESYRKEFFEKWTKK